MNLWMKEFSENRWRISAEGGEQPKEGGRDKRKSRRRKMGVV